MGVVGGHRCAAPCSCQLCPCGGARPARRSRSGVHGASQRLSSVLQTRPPCGPPAARSLPLCARRGEGAEAGPTLQCLRRHSLRADEAGKGTPCSVCLPAGGLQKSWKGREVQQAELAGCRPVPGRGAVAGLLALPASYRMHGWAPGVHLKRCHHTRRHGAQPLSLRQLAPLPRTSHHRCAASCLAGGQVLYGGGVPVCALGLG